MLTGRRAVQLESASLTLLLLRSEALAAQDVRERLGRECQLFEELDACSHLYQDDGPFVVDQAVEPRRLQSVCERQFSHGFRALMYRRQGEALSRALRRAAFPLRW